MTSKNENPKIPPPPASLSTSGAGLWRKVVADFELAEHELALLRQAGQTLDAIDRLQAALAADDVIEEGSQGRKVHPALPELRQQRITFARLIAQLGAPDDDGGRPCSAVSSGEERSAPDAGCEVKRRRPELALNDRLPAKAVLGPKPLWRSFQRDPYAGPAVVRRGS